MFTEKIRRSVVGVVFSLVHKLSWRFTIDIPAEKCGLLVQLFFFSLHTLLPYLPSNGLGSCVFREVFLKNLCRLLNLNMCVCQVMQ